MTRMHTFGRSTAMAALLALPLGAGAALGQQAQSTDSAQPPATTQGATGTQSAQSGATGGSTSGEAADQQADTLIATVGDAEIRGSDLMTVIGMLPPQLQAQPAQMLVPIALDQLIMRELILEQARSENLAEDPEVIALVEGRAEGAEEDAMVQVWIERELGNAVTDDAVEQVYGALQPQGGQPVPPMASLRPQIEEHLRRQAMEDVRERLQQGASIVLYDPSGQPLPDDQQIRGTQNTSSDAGNASGSGSEGSTDASSGSGSDAGTTGDEPATGTSGD